MGSLWDERGVWRRGRSQRQLRRRGRNGLCRRGRSVHGHGGVRCRTGRHADECRPATCSFAKYSSSGVYLWAKRFGGWAGDDYAYAIAVNPRANCDGSGNQSTRGCVVFTGAFKGTADFGGLSVPGPAGNNYNFFAAKLSPSGSPLWVKTYGNTNQSLGRAIAVDASGDVALTGKFFGALHIVGTQGSFGNNDIFVAKVRGTDGSGVWASRYGSDGNDRGFGIAFDPAGNIDVTGSFNLLSGGVTFGGETWTASGVDAFIAQLNGTTGTHRWSRHCAGTYTNVRQGNGVATDSAGNVVITGWFYGSVNCGPDTPTLTGVGYNDALAAKFSASGAPVWMKRYGCPGCADLGSAGRGRFRQ